MTVQGFVDFIVVFSTELLIPLMVGVFVLGISFRVLIWWTVRRKYWFSSEFDKRVQRYINSTSNTDEVSFFRVTKRLLEITFYELFEIRSIMKRRNPDVIMAWVDRVFLIQQGCARIVNDVLRKIRFFKFEQKNPNFSEVSKTVFQNNPCFNRIFGVIPISGFNDFLNILPNMFIVCGILGTFLGIMKALPELGGMDLGDVENSKAIMDTFLLKISFSMSTSIVGIVLSVIMTFLNTFFSAEKLFVNTVDSLNESLQVLWDLSSNNNLPESNEKFDSSRDPIEVLAEDVVVQELRVQPGFVKLVKPVQGWWLKETNIDKEKLKETSEKVKSQYRENAESEDDLIDRRENIHKDNTEDYVVPIRKEHSDEEVIMNEVPPEMPSKIDSDIEKTNQDSKSETDNTEESNDDEDDYSSKIA